MPKLTQGVAARERRDKILAEGKCINCGAARNLYSHHCDVCYSEMQNRRRKRLGMNPWTPGGKGRPPKKAPPATKEETSRAHKETVIERVLGTPPSGARRVA